MPVAIDQTVLDIANAYLTALRTHGICFESAWLFGSCARGGHTEDSDIDIAVVMPHAEPKFFKELELMKLRRNIDVFDVVLLVNHVFRNHPPPVC